MDPRDVAKLRLAKSFLEIRVAAKACGLEDALAAPARKIYRGDVPARSERAFSYVDDGSLSLAEFLLSGDRLLKPIMTESHLRVLRRDITSHLLRILQRDAKAAREEAVLDLPPDLMAWAREHDVADLMAGPLAQVNLEQPKGDWYAILRARHDQTIEAFLRDENVARRDAVFEWLGKVTERRRTANAEEQERNYANRPLPEEPEAQQLIEHLRRVRSSLRQTIRPRRAADYVVVETTLTDTNPPYFCYEEAPADRPRWSSQATTVTVPLALDDSSPRPVCRRCERDCIHGLAALDHLLGVLFEVEGTLSRRAVLEAAATPTWERWITELDRELERLDEDSAVETDGRLWWGVDRERQRVMPYVELRGKKGTFLKPKRMSPEKVRDTIVIRAPDESILLYVELLESARRSYRTAEIVRRYAQVLTRLAGHPLVFVGRGPPRWSVQETPVGLTAEEVGHGVAVRVKVGELMLSADEWAAHQATFLITNGTLAEFDEDCRTIRVTTIDRRIDRFLERWRSHDATIPTEAQDALMSRLSRVARHVPLVGSDVITRTEQEPRADIVLVLTPLPRDVGLMIEVRVRPLEHGPLFAPAVGADEVTASTPDRQIVCTTRDRGEELGHANAVTTAIFGDDYERDGWSFLVDELEPALELVERLRDDDRVECVWPQRVWQRPKTVTASAVHIGVRGRTDWFDIDGRAEVDDTRVDLALMLDAARANQQFLELGDGNFLAFERSLFERLRELEPHTTVTKSGIELALGGAEPVDALGAYAAAYESPDEWGALLTNIRAAKDLKPRPPRSLAKTLRDYQKEGHAWLSRLAAWNAGAVLADDMGLGKTIQAIAVLMDRSVGGPQLVVAPTSVCFNWARELETFAPKLNAIMYAGPQRAAKLRSLKKKDVLIASYAVVQRDADLLGAHRFNTLVLDEAQAIKNPSTKRSRAVRSLDRAWAMALTGTPVENHPGELWALFAAVFPGLLGSWERFKRRFLEDEREVAIATAALSNVVRPFVLRRTKAAVAKELPPRTQINIDVVLSERERALYDDARLAAVAKIEQEGRSANEGAFRFRVLAALTRLRQLACHPRLVDDDSTVPSAKLDRLMEIVKELIAEGRRALVFSQFTKHLALVREALEEQSIAYQYLDGSTPAASRGDEVDKFQSGDVPLFLISVKAGGTGLNLTAADTVVHLDPWWNPAVEDQATDRAHRIGQTNPVTVYRMVTRDTVEERILELHADKRKMVEDLLSGTGESAKLDADTLASLITETGQPGGGLVQ